MPLHDMSKSMPPAALRGRSPRAGVPGEEHPRHPLRRLGSLHARQGAVASALRACRPHQPLDPHSARKAHHEAPTQPKEQSKSSPKGKGMMSERCRRQAAREHGGAWTCSISRPSSGATAIAATWLNCTGDRSRNTASSAPLASSATRPAPMAITWNRSELGVWGAMEPKTNVSPTNAFRCLLPRRPSRQNSCACRPPG